MITRDASITKNIHLADFDHLIQLYSREIIRASSEFYSQQRKLITRPINYNLFVLLLRKSFASVVEIFQFCYESIDGPGFRKWRVKIATGTRRT